MLGQVPGVTKVERNSWQLKLIEPPGSASGPDVLPHAGPNPSRPVGQDATTAELPDEDAMKMLNSIEPPGSASGPEAVSTDPPESFFEEPPDWGNSPDVEVMDVFQQDVIRRAISFDLGDVELANEFQQEVQKPVSDSCDASLEEAIALARCKYAPKRMRAFKGEASEAIWHAAKAFRGSEGAR